MEQSSEYRQFAPFSVEQTSKSPGISFNPNINLITISGISVPENHVAFYTPILAWFEAFVKNPPERTHVVMKMEYFNTSSSTYLLKIFRALEQIVDMDKKIELFWVYEEDDWDMKECGTDYKSLVKFPFNLKPVKEGENSLNIPG